MKIAYLTNCFGIQSHTFIRREIAELNKLGIEVELFGIHEEMSDRLTPPERALVERTTYLYPLPILRIIYLNLFWMLFRARRYWPTLWTALTNKEPQLKQRLKLVYHFFIAPYLADAMAQKKVEHIHAHFLNVSSTMAMYASLLTGIPYSITVHSAGTKNAPHIIGIPLKLKYAQFLVMISHYNIDYFDAIYPCRDKSSVVRCGMDLDHYPFRTALQLKAESGQGAPRILAVGRLVEKKGFEYLIDAVGIVKTRHPQVPFKLEVVGSGPLEEHLKRKVAELGIQDSVIFYGPASTDEVRDKMLDSTVVVVPSVTGRSGEMEGIPVVLMEAMALGVPVISTQHSGIPELVRNGETGVIVGERDAEALALALQHFIGADSGDVAERAQRVQKARDLIEEEFNISVVAKQRQDLLLQHRHQYA
jgi:colanic acid/amylovoran biosynthesis glycosyltransferase